MEPEPVVVETEEKRRAAQAAIAVAGRARGASNAEIMQVMEMLGIDKPVREARQPASHILRPRIRWIARQS